MAGHRPVAEFTAARHAKVAVWKNDDNYAISIQPPQYKNDQGEWKTGQIWVTDIPGIIHALERAQAFIDAQQ